MNSLISKGRRRNLLWVVVTVCLVILAVFIGFSLQHRNTGNNSHQAISGGGSLATGGDPATANRVCGRPILNSPYTYGGAAGNYSSNTPGLPTYGAPGTDFPNDTAGVVLPAGVHTYASYQLRPYAVYYLLPGTHIGSLMANTGDAFVGGLADGKRTVLSGNYSQYNWGIDSNSTDGDQSGVTVEYMTIEKYQPDDNAAAINQDSNTGWTIRYNTITLNVPGAGVILGADNTLNDNCLTLNGQYGFQSVATGSWGVDKLTDGPYDITVKNNEISYNDTCDFEGLLSNSAIGWSNRNPVPPQYRNSQCPPVTPDGNEGGFKLWQTDGVTIADNYIHNNWGPGAWADTNNANTTYAHNVITNNDDEAIVEEISYNFAIIGNYMANNGWAAGLSNSGFPTPAIYISESGSDRTFGGVPACPESSCSGQSSYQAQSLISTNTMVNNGGSVFLWQSSNRFCSDGADAVCTLVGGGASGPFTLSACKVNLPSASFSKTTYAGNMTGSPSRDWWDGCLWRTENVSINHNTIDFNPASIMDCKANVWPACGAGGVFSQYGSPPNNVAPWTVPTQITFYQHNSWSHNVYNGPSTFYAWNQGNRDNPVGWANWTGKTSSGDDCSSPGEHTSGFCEGPFGQDTGSTYSSDPPS